METIVLNKEKRFMILEEKKNFLEQYRCYFTILLVIVNIVWYIIMELSGDVETTEDWIRCGAMLSDAIQKGNYSQLFTAFFVHFSIRHLANNMFLLLIIGAMLEKHIGSIRFLLIYIVGGIGGNVVSAYWHVRQDVFVISAGASGAIFGIVGGFLMALILNKGRIEDMTVKKMAIFVALSLYQGFVNRGIDNAAHVGGFLVGMIVSILCELTRRKPKQELV